MKLLQSQVGHGQEARAHLRQTPANHGEVGAYLVTVQGALASVPRECLCGGRLKGNGRRYRWAIPLGEPVRIPIQMLRCPDCRVSTSHTPKFLGPRSPCTRELAARIRAAWCDGLYPMRDVRHAIKRENPKLRLCLSSMYRWARMDRDGGGPTN